MQRNRLNIYRLVLALAIFQGAIQAPANASNSSCIEYDVADNDNHDDGHAIPAAQTIEFSPDGRYYLATRQMSDLDAIEWFVCTHNGEQVWSGIPVIQATELQTPAAVSYAQLSRPAWTDMHTLNARAQCSVDAGDALRSVRVQLVEQNNTWQWLPQLDCLTHSNPTSTEQSTSWQVIDDNQDFYLDNGQSLYPLIFDVGVPKFIGTATFNDEWTIVLYHSGDAGTSTIIRITRGLLFNNGRFVANVPFDYLNLNTDQPLGPRWDIQPDKIIIEDEIERRRWEFPSQPEQD